MELGDTGVVHPETSYEKSFSSSVCRSFVLDSLDFVFLVQLLCD